MPPGRDRRQRGVDHRRARHRQQRARAQGRAGERRPCRRQPALRARRQQPRQQRQRRCVGKHRHHALARQPGRAPLRERPPRAQRLAQVRGRAQQPGGDQQQRRQQPRAERAQRQLRRAVQAAVLQQRQRAQPQHQAVAGAGQSGEENDRKSGMHASAKPVSASGNAGNGVAATANAPARHRDSTLSSQRSTPGSACGSSVSCGAGAAASSARRGRGGRYLLVGR